MLQRLMIPGPVPITSAVQSALAGPIQAHYGKDWGRVYNEMLAMLGKVFGTSGSVLCLVGSGTSGIDASLGSFLSPGDHVIVPVTGYHSERMVVNARSYGAYVTELAFPWGQAVAVDAVADALKRGPRPVAVLMTHVETSTGVLNPVVEVGRLLRDSDTVLVVDAVAALGGIEYAMDEWGIDFCCSATQKCLASSAGMAPLAVSARGWEAIKRRSDTPRSYYLDLKLWREFACSPEWSDWHPHPVSVPSVLVFALHAALKELLQEGVANRAAYYRGLARQLREGLPALGMSPLVPEPYAAPTVTSVRPPASIPANDIVGYLEEELGIKISPTFGPLSNRAFRIGHMSPAVTPKDVDDVLFALAVYMERRGARMLAGGVE